VEAPVKARKMRAILNIVFMEILYQNARHYEIKKGRQTLTKKKGTSS
jgi:hypothetical protein